MDQRVGYGIHKYSEKHPEGTSSNMNKLIKLESMPVEKIRSGAKHITLKKDGTASRCVSPAAGLHLLIHRAAIVYKVQVENAKTGSTNHNKLLAVG
jgi:hypothetical protein